VQLPNDPLAAVSTASRLMVLHNEVGAMPNSHAGHMVNQSTAVEGELSPSEIGACSTAEE